MIPSYIWTTKNVYVDTETGEELTKYQMQLNYTIVKKTRNVKRDKNTGLKYVEQINECRRQAKQQSFNF